MTGGARAAIECLLALPSRCAVHKLHRTVHAVVLPCIGFEWVRSSTPTSSCRRRCATTAQPLTPGLVPEKRLDAHVFSENDKRKTARSHKNTAPMPLCNPTPGPSPPPLKPSPQDVASQPCAYTPSRSSLEPALATKTQDTSTAHPADSPKGQPLSATSTMSAPAARRGTEPSVHVARTRQRIPSSTPDRVPWQRRTTPPPDGPSTPQSSASLTGLAAIIFLSLVKLLPPRELMSPFFFFALVL